MCRWREGGRGWPFAPFLPPSISHLEEGGRVGGREGGGKEEE
jgi:hypothetical protein